MSGLVATGLASYIHQEGQKADYYKRHDLEHKAKESEKRMEKKTKKRSNRKKPTTSHQVEDEDVTMSKPTDANQPSTSSTVAK